MAGSRLPRQLFLQGVAAVFMFAFASLYTQIPGEGASSDPRHVSALMRAGAGGGGTRGVHGAVSGADLARGKRLGERLPSRLGGAAGR